MKMSLFLSFTVLLLLTALTEMFAQAPKTDVIIRRDNTKLEALIQEVEAQVIKYKKANNPTGPLYTIAKSEIATILYRNGEVETFPNVAQQTPAAREMAETHVENEFAPPPPARNSFERNVQQMKTDQLHEQHKLYKAKAKHGLVGGIVFTVLGVTAIGVGAALVSDPYYYDGYLDYYYDENKYIGGVAALVGGFALAGGLGTVGWIKMARNRSKAKVIAHELIRRKEPLLSFRLMPGYNPSNRVGSLGLTLRF